MSDPKSSPTATRRSLFAGVGTLGAVAAVAAVAPRLLPAEPKPVAQAQPEADPAGGYQLTDHVKRYYQTARV